MPDLDVWISGVARILGDPCLLRARPGDPELPHLPPAYGLPPPEARRPMPSRIVRIILALVIVGGGATVLALVLLRLTQETAGNRGRRGQQPSPVEVAAVRTGTIVERQTFSGSLQASADFMVAAKVPGRLREVLVDVGDTVQRGQVVARLDDEEQVQDVAQAEAAVVVARARQAEAASVVGAAERAYQRITILAGEGRATEAAKDQAEADMLAARAAVAVADAGIAQAEADLAAARVRLGYRTILADWSGDGSERIIGERLVDSGATISANQPLLRVLDLKPVEAVIHVTERIYGRIRPDQGATLTTDAWPGATFPARVQHIAPRFDPASRQAAVTLVVDNADARLKPGMFVRATLALSEAADTTLVPSMALTRRDGRDVVFVVNGDGTSVREVGVEVGIRDGDLTQVSGDGVQGQVVTLGQQLISDGAVIVIAAQRPPPGAAEPGASTP